MTSAPGVQSAPPGEPHPMQCLEIWGGSGAAHEAVSVHGVDLYVASQPFGGAAAGGDIYLASMCDHGQIARFVLADVAGHGETAGALSGALRRLMRENIGTVDQTRLARELNREFSAVARAGRFATAVLATYFAPTDHLIVVNAGHPPPLWYRARERTWQLLEARAALPAAPPTSALANLPLGVIEPTDYEQFAVALEPRDLVLLYTDALIETAAPGGAPLGPQGLLALMTSLDVSDPNAIPDATLAALDRLRRGAPPDDDLTLLVLHHNAADPPRLSLGERLRVLARSMGIGRLESEPS